MYDFKDKVVVVTGGAQGIGKCICEEFEKQGAKVCTFTGKTANTGVSSATIIGINGGLGDALTTALCLCEYSAVKTNSPLTTLANKIITEYPDCMIFIVYKKEQTKLILTNKTLNQHFTITDQSYSVVNI